VRIRVCLLSLGLAACGDRAWDPDGERIVFAVDDNGGAGVLAQVDLDGQRGPDLLRSADRLIWPRVSPDGSQIAYVQDRGSELVIWIADLVDDQLENETVVDTLPGQSLARQSLEWRPTGGALIFGYAADDFGALMLLELDGEEPFTSGLAYGAGTGHFSPDGERVVFSYVGLGDPPEDSSIRIWDAATEEPSLPFDVHASGPRWSPDGDAILVRLDDGARRSGILEWPGGGVTELPFRGGSTRWSPDGTQVAAFATEFDSCEHPQFIVYTLETGATVSTDSVSPSLAPRWSRSGRLAAVSDVDHHLVLIDPETAGASRFAEADPVGDGFDWWSPM
jgi:Tol biopolymer transport system component